MKLRHHLLTLCIILSFDLLAAPWVEVDDIGLRADIQLLADTGVINIPVSTYPLMWASVAQSIENTDPQELTEMQQVAYSRIKRKLATATNSSIQSTLEVDLNTNDRRFSSFGNKASEKQRAAISLEKISSNWAGKININYSNSNTSFVDNAGINLDGSYLAYKLDNWVISLASLDQWWGPGLDTSLIMSNNSRPLPALSIRRNTSIPFESPILNWIGPWTFSAQMAQLENERFIPDARIWSSRATFKPYRKIEIGLAWSYQWAGEGQPSSFEQFFNGLVGETECVNGASSCDEALQTKLGNQLAGFDARWSDSINGIPYALYAQTIGEDSPSPGTLQISDKSFLYGIETQFNFQQQQILANIEYSDTQANCGARGDTTQDCFYEHGLYKSGYRYYRRSIGSTYDNDAKSLVFTLFGQQINGNSWQLKLRNLNLNTNNRDRYPNDPELGNSVSKIALQVDQIEFQYQFNLFNGRLSVGGLLSNERHEQQKENDFDVFLKYSYFIN